MSNEPARNFIVVHDDNETYCPIAGATIVALTDQQLRDAEAGGEKNAIAEAIESGFEIARFTQTESGRTLGVHYLIAAEEE